MGGAPASTAAAAPATTPSAAALTVTHVVDGDTVDVSSGERVRLIGIDTPERGECGFDAATRRVEELVAGAAIQLVPGARDDVDRYGRILRYVEADGTDVGRVLIDEGLAISRYDGRDGYGAHPRQADYQARDEATAHLCGMTNAAARQPVPDPSAAASTATGSAYSQNCTAARAAGAAPLLAGSPGYRSALDRDNDGLACE
jgi:hypothetical protein